MTKALIFDFSDTLTNSVEARTKAFQELAQQFFPSLGGKAGELMLLYWKTDLQYPRSSVKQILKKTVHRFCTHQDMACDIDVDAFYIAYRKKVKEYECVRQSFIEVFPELKKRYRLFILTIEPRKTVESLLRKAGIAPEEFDEIITGTELRAWDIPKMSIHIYEYLCKSHGLTPAECVMVGDSPLIDMLPAQTAGLQTMLFCSWAKRVTTNLEILLEDDFFG